jgi:hypothetical protein
MMCRMAQVLQITKTYNFRRLENIHGNAENFWPLNITAQNYRRHYKFSIKIYFHF